MTYAYVLTGETFQNLKAIKASGFFSWDIKHKVWVRRIDPTSIKADASVKKFIKTLPGVSVVEEPAHKYRALDGKVYW